jgi:hypothetical protein
MHATKANRHDTFHIDDTEEGTNRSDGADQSQVTETQTSSNSIGKENAPPPPAAATNNSSSSFDSAVKTPATTTHPSRSSQEQEFQSMHQLIAAPGNGDGNPRVRSDNDTTKQVDEASESKLHEVNK